jgi:hypothetical protein
MENVNKRSLLMDLIHYPLKQKKGRPKKPNPSSRRRAGMIEKARLVPEFRLLE